MNIAKETSIFAVRLRSICVAQLFCFHIKFFIKPLLNISSMLGIVEGACDKAVNKIVNNTCPHGIYDLVQMA